MNNIPGISSISVIKPITYSSTNNPFNYKQTPSDSKVLYCRLVLDELQRQLNLPLPDYNPRFCEFPLVCNPASTNNLVEYGSYDIQNSQGSGVRRSRRLDDSLTPNSTCTSFTCLQPHPHLFSMKREELYTMPIDDSRFIEFKQYKVTSGAYGTTYKIQHHQHKYIVKLQRIIDDKINDQVRNLVELNKGQNSYVAYSFITEALALYSLNRCEQEHGSFDSTQSHTVPIIYCTLVLKCDDELYSAIVMENIHPGKPYSFINNDYLIGENFKTKLQNITNRMFESPINMKHYDLHRGNIMVRVPDRIKPFDSENMNRNKMTDKEIEQYMVTEEAEIYILDFGMVAFCIPKEYMCSVVDPIEACHDNKIYIQSLTIFPQQNYNMTKGDGKYYHSKQFKRDLVDFELSNTIPCDDFSSYCTNKGFDEQVMSQLKTRFPKQTKSFHQQINSFIDDMEDQTEHHKSQYEKFKQRLVEHKAKRIQNLHDEIEFLDNYQNILEQSLDLPNDKRYSSYQTTTNDIISDGEYMKQNIFRSLKNLKFIVEFWIQFTLQDPNIQNIRGVSTRSSKHITTLWRQFHMNLVEYNQTIDNARKGKSTPSLVFNQAEELLEQAVSLRNLYLTERPNQPPDYDRSECIVL